MRSIPWPVYPFDGGRRLRRVSILAAGAALLCLAAGCHQSPPPEQESTAAKPPEVTTVRPERKTVRYLIEQPGYNIEAFEQTPLYAKVAGYVRKVHADIGDAVKGPQYDSAGKLVREGDLLVELWVPELEVELREKQAAVQQADAAVEQAVKLLAVATAHVESVRGQVKEAQAARLRARADSTFASSQYDRLERVSRGGVLDKENVDEARFRSEAAKASMAETEARIQAVQALVVESEANRDRAAADVTVARTRLQVAQAQRDNVRTLLDYTKIRAPFDGRVTRRNVNTGDFVQPAVASGSKGEPLMNVDRQDEVRVFVNVPELDAAWVHDRAPAYIRVQSLRGEMFSGQVTRSAYAFNPQTRTLRTEIDLLNPNGRLRPGMYVYATIVAEHRDVWTLPSSAVVTQGEQTFCYGLRDNKAVRLPIQIGLRGDDLVEVVKKQVEPAPKPMGTWKEFTGREEIIREAAKVADGQQVQVREGK